MRAHSDQDIISKASKKEKVKAEIKGDKIDITVDMDDSTGAAHTYVVTYQKVNPVAEEWEVIDVSELSTW